MAFTAFTDPPSCECWYPICYAACGDYQEPNRWWSKTRCATCGHGEDCHTRRILDGLQLLVSGDYEWQYARHRMLRANRMKETP